MNPYESYIYKSRYARYLPDEKRREEWPETVSRYISFFKEKHPDAEIPWDELEQAILNREIMPSMRCMMTAGPALERDNVAGYNCAYVSVDNTRVFDEIMYILMCGTGVGFSVERQAVQKLPEVAEDFHDVDSVIKVRDSKIGWASAFRQLIGVLYQGQVPRWDTSGVRSAGSYLRTFGGRASGPRPLEDLFRFSVELFKVAKGRRLTSLECHDLICKVAEVVVCGGVRRSALLSLSNLTDERMRRAKTGDWHNANPQRALANNSVCYTERPDMGIFMREWESLYSSKSGERGIFNRAASIKMCPDRRDSTYDFGTNPCSEIILRSKQFCNLSEVICGPTDTESVLRRKVHLATILGTLQASLVNFRYLSRQWSINTGDERLLGVSLTGIMDNDKLGASYIKKGGTNEGRLRGLLERIKEEAVATNREYADRIGIPMAAAITCVKPSGTVSQLCNTSSGIHPRYSPYYIRRVRADVNDPLCGALIGQGVPHEVAAHNSNELVFSFPMDIPSGSVSTEEVSAIVQLEHWKIYAEEWCEHKPSISIYVREHEWLRVGAWVYENWEIMNGVSFFPKDDHIYEQAPYEPITEEEYKKLKAEFPKELDLTIGEEGDNTTASQELACVGGACEL